MKCRCRSTCLNPSSAIYSSRSIPASTPGASRSAFGANVDYGSIIKTFSHTELMEQRRYSPPEVIKVEKLPVMGRPDVELISTSYVEKQNHTLRMHCRRLSRLTNAFSKKMENFRAAVALQYAYYNFVKIHKAITAQR